MKYTSFLFHILIIAVAASCVKEYSAGEQNCLHEVTLSAEIADGKNSTATSKATVTSEGVVAWEQGDKIGVYTTKSQTKIFTCTSVSADTGSFTGKLDNDENPDKIAVFPGESFKALNDNTLTVSYPSEYDYEKDDMRAPMAALVSGTTLAFKQLGGMVHIECPSVPTQARALVLEAEDRKIAGEFSVSISEGMHLSTSESESDTKIKVDFPAGTTSLAFNIPVPTGNYPNFIAHLLDADNEVLLKWVVVYDAEVNRADMYARQEPEVLMINGTLIAADNDRYGLVTDSSTGNPIAGVPVTDGYTYTSTDENGVYQLKANAYSRAVYPSIPAAYEIPVSSLDGEPAFWKTAKGRNDFELTPRTGDWNEFNIIGISDVHFYVVSKDEFKERDKYRSTALADINSYISDLNNVIVINTGDISSNHTRALADARAEFALIKKDGKTVPMLNTIGNHDHSNDLTLDSTWECSQDYFDVFGPTEYSVNIGKAHIVFLNNIIYSGHDPAGYGKAMQCDFGITEEIYSWLLQDLATVDNKGDKILILCLHAPIFNNDYQNYLNLRNLMKTFGETHIMSGHDHHNVRREFSDSWKGINGRIPEEHNMPPLGNYWLNDYTTAGVPNGYHRFKISGASMTEQHFKATGISEADCQFRIYDSNASYHDPIDQVMKDELLVDKDGKIYFDWAYEFENEKFDKSKGVIVRVFDAGTRALDCKVFFIKDGDRKEMTRVANSHRDQWAFCYLWYNGWQNNNFPSAYHRGRRNQNYWYFELESGPLSTLQNWEVEVELNGRKFRSSTITQ